MKAQHTRGPYSISGIAGDNLIMARAGGERQTVAIVMSWPGMSTDELDANKRLLQAAPELLEALRDCVESLSRMPEVDGAFKTTCLHQARSAIAKATG